MTCWRCVVTAFLLSHCAYAQAFPASSVITGKVSDSHQLPVAGIKVHLDREDKKESVVTETDSTGMYRFSVPSGTYSLRAENGKDEAKAGPLAVGREKVTINLTLKPAETTQAQFFDEPQFTVAGVSDNTYRGGHGSDTVLRSSEDLTKATASLAGSSSEHDAAEPHHALAEADERSGQPLEAVKEFQTAAELNPSERNLFDWGTELLSHRAAKAAGEVFMRGARLYPDAVRMLLGSAAACYAEGAYEQATHWFFQATDLRPADPEPYEFLGKVEAHEIRQRAGYKERMARFARLQPNNALANYYYALSVWQERTGAGDAAIIAETRDLLDKAVSIDPHFGRAYLQLGIVYAAEQKYPEAIHSYQKAISENPELEEPHYRLSEAYRVTSDRVKAHEELLTYKRLLSEDAAKVERERREVQQFVIALRQTNRTQ